ncbi:MAG: ABC transporter permease [Candidatus Aminicenantes bacterium]|nr:ABC transporter permease [Candidatus Aminicenantes bacterium]
MNYEFFVAKRYLTARRKQAFISVITFISTLGITIGVMALIIAIALITGFQGDVQEKILGATAHIMISDLTGDGIADYEDLMDRVKDLPGVAAVTPVVYNPVLIKGPIKSLPAVLRGLDLEAERKHAVWLNDIELGELPADDMSREGILLGRDVAFNVGAGVGDVITVVTASTMLSPTGLFPRMRKFIVTGIFQSGLYEFDSTTVLVNLSSAQRLFRTGERVSFIHIRLNNIFDAPEIAERIEVLMPTSVYTATWMDMNRSLFSALKLEKNIMFLTISLIVFVAALNIIATLILMVMEKTRDIGILLAMGATSMDIRRIFFFQGAMIGIIGTLAGTGLGLLWCWLANVFELIKIPQDIYQIPFVPFYIKPVDLLIIIVVTLGISFVSTLFPAYRASRVDPVTALKYE